MNTLIAIPDWGVIPSTGPAYIASSLRKAGWRVDGYRFQGRADLQARLRDQHYDVVMTGGLCSEYKSLRTIVDEAKAAGAVTVLGGGIVTSEPELIHRAIDPDFSILGQGEETTPELLEALRRDTDPGRVPGIAFLKDDALVTTAARCEEKHLDALPFPDYDIFGLQQHLDAMRPSDDVSLSVFDQPRQYALVDSRSCPYRCTFCWHPSGNVWKCRSVDNIMAEVDLAVNKYRANIIFFIGELFSVNKKRVQELCERMTALRQQLPYELVWQACFRVNGLSNDMLKTMKAAGCYIGNYGFESHHQKVLDSMGKHITVPQIDAAIQMSRANNIMVSANFLLGDRSETFETAAESIRFSREHPEVAIPLKHIYVAPRSADYEHCIERGIIKDRLDHIVNHWSDPMHFSGLTRKQYRALMTQVLMLSYCPPILRSMVKRLGKDTIQFTCPHCHTRQTARRFIWRPLRTKRMICRHCCNVFLLTGWFRWAAEWLALNLTPKAAWPYGAYKMLMQLARKLQ